MKYVEEGLAHGKTLKTGVVLAVCIHAFQYLLCWKFAASFQGCTSFSKPLLFHSYARSTSCYESPLCKMYHSLPFSSRHNLALIQNFSIIS